MNLIRPVNLYLLNTVASGTTDCETMTDSGVYGSRKVFVHKKKGFTFVGNISGEANPILNINVLPGTAGTNGVKTVSLVGLYNTNYSSVDFAIKVTRKGRLNGETSEYKDISHLYNYEKKNFNTSSNGAYDATDTADILSELADRINSDIATGPNAIRTGTVVTALYVAANIDYASYTGTPTGATTAVTITAVTPGTGGNVTLVHDDTSTIAELIAAWNLDYFGTASTLALTTGDGTQIPTADIVIAGGTASVAGYIKLTSKDPDVRFDVVVDMQVFAIDAIVGVPVVQVPSAGKWTDVAQLFSIRPEHAGTLPESPIADTYYTKIIVTEKSVVGSMENPNGQETVTQVSEIWTPNASADALNDPLIAQLVLASLDIYKNGVAWT